MAFRRGPPARSPRHSRRFALAALLGVALLILPAFVSAGPARPPDGSNGATPISRAPSTPHSEIATGPPHALDPSSRPRASAAAAEATPGISRTVAAGNGTWEQLPGTETGAPPPRSFGGSAFDAATGEFVEFGGLPASGPATNDTWSLSDSGWRELTPSAAPSPRSNFGMTYDTALGTVVLFGGYDGVREVALNDTWEFANGTWVRAATPVAPTARLNPSFAYDPTLAAVVLFGGDAVNGSVFPPKFTPLGDTWKFTGQGWSEVNASRAPSARVLASMLPDPADGGLVLFGGTNASAVFSDTWIFNGSGWGAAPTTPNPGPVFAAAGDWDPTGGYALLFGGYNGSAPTNASWAFAAGQWTKVADPVGPSPRVGAIGAWDAALDAFVAFGGSSSFGFPYSAFNDTWVYFDPLRLAGPPGPAGVDVGIPAGFAVGPVGGLLPLGYAWSFGDGTFASSSAPSHAYAIAGSYVLNVTVSDASGAVAASNLTVTVAPLPQISVGTAPAVPEVGLPLDLVANVTGGTSPFGIVWNFSDGSTATGAQVPHTFATPGTAIVVVTLRDAAGATTRATVPIFVVTSLQATISPPAGEAEVGVPVDLSASASSGAPPYTASWTFGDGSGGTGFRVVHAYASPGSFSAEVTTVDSSGGTAHASATVVVASRLNVSILPGPLDTDVGAPIALTAVPQGGVPPYSYAWTFGDGGSALGPGAAHGFASTGTFTVELNATDGHGVAASASVEVQVRPAPAASVRFNPSPADVGAAVTFTADVTGGRAPFAYAWNFGDGTGGAGATSVHTYSAAGTYSVSLAVTDAANLTSVASVVEVVAAPPASGPSPTSLAGEAPTLGALGAVAAGAFALVVVLRSGGRRPPAPGHR